MRTILRKAIFPVLLTIILASNSEAKRLPPTEVNPVEKDGIQYRAPHWGVTEGRNQNGGYIEAWDVKRHKRLWGIQVYKSEINPAKERDVQDVFITTLAFQGIELLVRNERGEVYSVDVMKRKVKKVAGASSSAKGKAAP